MSRHKHGKINIRIMIIFFVIDTLLIAINKYWLFNITEVINACGWLPQSC